MNLEILVNPTSVHINDEITITAVTGVFNSSVQSNIVTIDSILCEIISGTNTSLIVKVPKNSINGLVQVKYKENTEFISSNVATISILYEDETFESTLIQSGTPSVFNQGSNLSAIYNRDLSYSNFSEITDENTMIQNLYTILLTRRGSRFFNPSFGSSIEELLFSVISDYNTFEENLMNEINILIKTYEPRIVLDSEQSFVVFNEDYHAATIVLYVRVPSGNVKTISVTFKNPNYDSGI